MIDPVFLLFPFGWRVCRPTVVYFKSNLLMLDKNYASSSRNSLAQASTSGLLSGTS